MRTPFRPPLPRSIDLLLTTSLRTLDELDEMFEQRLWAWQFSKYETTGAASRFAHVNQEQIESKGDDLIMEEVSRVSTIPSLCANTVVRADMR